jgi:hypothetical protein
LPGVQRERVEAEFAVLGHLGAPVQYSNCEGPARGRNRAARSDQGPIVG